jgi:hypothetical protein
MAEMISFSLLLYCVAAACAYLLVVSTILELVERRLRLTAGLPETLVEPFSLAGMLTNFVLESMFLVVVPTLIYGFFFYIIPFSGIRAGMAASLFAFALGVVPAILGLTLRVKLPVSYVLFVILSLLIKLTGCLTVIAWLHSL